MQSLQLPPFPYPRTFITLASPESGSHANSAYLLLFLSLSLSHTQIMITPIRHYPIHRNTAMASKSKRSSPRKLANNRTHSRGMFERKNPKHNLLESLPGASPASRERIRQRQTDEASRWRAKISKRKKPSKEDGQEQKQAEKTTTTYRLPARERM